jgi:hypothetical protein
MASIKLPLRETARVASVKLPLKETALVLQGFIMKENIISWKEQTITLMENIKSRILLQAQLLDKNHVLLKWFGEKVPKVQIFSKFDGDEYLTKPAAIVNWSPQEYTMLVGSNGYDIKVIGLNGTGESNEISLGESKEYDVDCSVELPINEKNYFFDIFYVSEYRIEVDL